MMIQMKWAEIIMIRLAGNNPAHLDATVEKLMNDLELEVRRKTIRFFRNEKLVSDICIVLFHNQKKKTDGGSILGLHLVSALKEVGLVNHTIWHNMDQINHK